MGVYHLMGLGTSPGVVTGPLSYLAHRYQRWNAEDERFFSRSGEAQSRQKGKKVGDIQALVLFSTAEVLQGRLLTVSATRNKPGKTQGGVIECGAMKTILGDLLDEILPAITLRSEVSIFWCTVNRQDIRNVYERAIRVIAALSGVGGQGKEMWINLTGGNNVINFALELAATLSGQIARLYYVQAHNQDAERCVFFPTEENYWIELPAMPLSVSPVMRAILDILSLSPDLSDSELYSRLLQHEQYWNIVQGIAPANFSKAYLEPMWKQGLIQGDKKYIVGAQWELIQPYEALWQEVKEQHLTIEQLAKQADWIEHQELKLR